MNPNRSTAIDSAQDSSVTSATMSTLPPTPKMNANAYVQKQRTGQWKGEEGLLGPHLILNLSKKERQGNKEILRQNKGNVWWAGVSLHRDSEETKGRFRKMAVWRWVHRGRSDTVANANANSDAPREFACEFLATKSQTKGCEFSVANEFACECECFTHEMRKFRPCCRNSLRMEVCDKIR